MDEQRIQAYVALIEQILSCADGEESTILRQQTELVDAGLLGVMQQYADRLEQQGNSKAEWLRQFAQRLATALGDTSTQTEGNLENADPFLLAVLQLVVDSQGNAQQVYPFLAQHQDQLNETLLQTLPQIAAALLAGNPEQQQFVAAVLMNFGNLIQQFPLGKRWLNLELGIVAYQHALTVRTQQAMPVDWAITMINLAVAYSDRIRGDRAENIEQAIATYQHALTVMTQQAMPLDWAQTLSNLANAYSNRIRGDRAENIEQAIDACQQALTVRTQQAMPLDWAATMMNLANAYSNRIRGDRAENIEQAIATYQQALTVMTQQAMPLGWALTMMNLATTYYSRIRGDRAENIEQAIDAYQHALTVMTQQAMPVNWATTMMNLAVAYSNRIRGDRAENIEQAIDACQHALTVRTQQAMPVNWATTIINLANAYSNRIRGDRAENIEQAIAAYEQALTVRTQQAMPLDWAQTMHNLANAYSNRIRGDRAENIEQAIVAYQQALTVRTRPAMPLDWAQTMHNLASAYQNRIRGNRAENIERAIAAYQSSLEIYDPELLPDNCRMTARSLSNLYSEQNRWAEAIPIYQKALQAAEILYQSATLLDGKAAELAETADLPRQAAYALARSGDLQDAALTLEQGRARSLSETLDRDRSNLSQLQQTHPALFTQYQDITQQLRNLETQQRLRMTSEERHNLTPEAFRTEALRLRQTLTQTIEQIRQVEGYADFLAQPSFDDIQQAIRPGIPLVYLVPTPTGSLALIVTQTGIVDLWLDDLTQTSLGEVLTAWFSAYDQSRTDRQSWYDAIDQVTRQLWQPLMAPLIDYLKQHSFQQVTLIPTGYLSLLPLHAAWTKDVTRPHGKRYALDEIHFTYAPNAQSINAAKDIAQRTRADSILAIDNPLKDLPNSSREVNAAIATFPQHKVLKHEEAAIESVLTALPDCNILHLSCHGIANLDEPLTSGLAMSDGLLTLRDLLDLKLSEQGGIRLAILSACETGLAGTENADEAISLPTGLLQAGVAGVVASLWSVSDLSTMLLLVRFYDLWRKEGWEAADALRQAQLWMRDTTSQQKAKYFQGTHPDIFQSLILLAPNYFAHPFHWAAFSYVGV
ncbi:MAG: tetratricopeptide repeat protein [Drouetiella hepatica Uher 2000/2452]|jgi:CHAT domain-containing protein/plasmid rolling circle replication initiator protein Rep|uniref:Tetratricopeptide repeat protein n=1 Tax=Drouetiella hepatica Uher 2000/2452 TaxID=904376 RepID=A0A951QFR4_9CYAN|nr:tetratricopeptide repeat protein [Drouetiella hepatica Uher 2000/2452]